MKSGLLVGLAVAVLALALPAVGNAYTSVYVCAPDQICKLAENQSLDLSTVLNAPVAVCNLALASGVDTGPGEVRLVACQTDPSHSFSTLLDASAAGDDVANASWDDGDGGCPTLLFTTPAEYAVVDSGDCTR